MHKARMLPLRVSYGVATKRVDMTFVMVAAVFVIALVPVVIVVVSRVVLFMVSVFEFASSVRRNCVGMVTFRPRERVNRWWVMLF